MGSLDTAQWLVRAKVSPARLPSGAAPRTRLLEQLEDPQHYQIVVAQAAAGFGKTTLLCQWREALVAAGTPVAWLSIDETDDPEILLPYLAFAFEVAGIPMRDTGLLDPKYQGAGIAHWLGLLIAHLEKFAGPIVLILDDLERCCPESATSIIESLLRHRPRNLRVCFAMRSNPGISLSRYRAAGELLSIDATALRFSPNEISGLSVNEGNAEHHRALVEAAGGWPVALALLARETSSAASASFTRSEHFEEYVREQLLHSMEPRLRGFLFAAAIPKEVDTATLNAVIGCEDAAPALAELTAQLSGLMLPVEAASEVYRLHPLVRETLESELEKSDPALNAQLRRNAAGWFEQQGRSLEAIRQAVAAGDGELAAQAFESMGAIQLFIREGMARFSRALKLIEKFELSAFPRVQFARATAAAKKGRIRESTEYLATAALALDRLQVARIEDVKLARIDSNICQMLLSQYACNPQPLSLESPQWHETLAMASRVPEVNVLILTSRCLYNLQMGNLEEGFQDARDAIEGCLGAHSLYGEMFIHVHLGMAQLARGRPDLGIEEHDIARRAAIANFSGDAGLKRVLRVVHSELTFEQGDSHAPLVVAKDIAKQRVRTEAWFDLHMAATQLTVECLLESGEIELGLTFVQEEIAHAWTEGLDRLARYLTSLHVCELLSAGRHDEAKTLAIGLGATEIDETQTWRENEIHARRRMGITRMQGQFEHVISDASQLIDYGERLGVARVKITGLLELALAHAERGATSEADEALSRAVRLGTPGGCVRPFLRVSSEVGSLLNNLAGDDELSNAERAFARTVSLRLKVEEPSSKDNGPWSQRELEMLDHLSQGKPDKVIARDVGLSAHGVRYHLKKLYTKLGVHNRSQAVAEARSRGLGME